MFVRPVLRLLAVAPCYGGMKPFRCFPILLAVVAFVVSGAQRNIGDLGGGDDNLHIPFLLNVGLLGFNNDGQGDMYLSPSDLDDALAHAITTYTPSVYTEDQEEAAIALNVDYHLEFQTRRLPPDRLRDYEEALRRAMVPAPADTVSVFTGVPTFDVEVTGELESQLDALFEEFFLDENGRHVDKDSIRALIFISPKKENIRPADLPDDKTSFRYRYTYEGSGYTQSWISSKNYIVVDLTAGPSPHGHTNAKEGTVVSSSFPRVKASVTEFEQKAAANTPRHELVAGMTALIMSAIEYVFVPDIGEETVVYAKKVVVPIIIFRDHTQFNPLEKGDLYDKELRDERKIDLKTVRAEMEKMLLPDQELVMPTAVHDLHDHKQIAGSLYSSLRYDTVYELKGTKYIPHTQRFLDGDSLLEQMGDDGDMLAEGLLKAARLYDVDPMIREMEKKEAQEEAQDLADLATDHDPAGQPFPERILGPTPEAKSRSGSPFDDSGETLSMASLRRARNKKKRRSKFSAVQGTRVVPVYVFSFASGLVSSGNDLLFHDHALYKSTRDAVIVIQNNAESIEVPYFAGRKRLHLEPRQPTQHIVAGLMESLGGLVPPHRRYSRAHKRTITNHIWSYGHHPFAPFSKSSQMSQIFVNTALRNGVLSRLDTALRVSKEAVNSVEMFARKYLFDDGSNVSWIDREFHNHPALKSLSEKSPIAFGVVSRLHEDMENLLNAFSQASDLIWESRFRDAHILSTSILRRAAGFHEFAIAEMRLKAAEMACCKVNRKVTHGVNAWSVGYVTESIADISDHIFFVPALVLLSLYIVWWSFQKIPTGDANRRKNRHSIFSGAGGRGATMYDKLR